MSINWKNKNSHITPHFTVHEALWLPSWRIYHKPSTAEKKEIIRLAKTMEKIRALYGVSIDVHCWVRPIKTNSPDSNKHGKNYNKAIGSNSTKSAHIFGRGIDFHLKGKNGATECAKVRKKILPHLKEWNIRMEDINGGWIHIDTSPVRNKRFFRP